MFEKFTDFDGKQFHNLWGGFSCECFADGINTFVMFYVKDEEVLSLSGNDANDILDFVLSKYYENENSTIEDGFSNWLMWYYGNVMPTFDGVEPKFKIGDWVVNKLGDSWHIDSFDKKNYQVSDGKGNYNYFPISKQDEMHLWNINDAKDGDVLTDEDNNIGIYKEIEGIDWDSYIYLGCDGKLRGFSIGGKHEQTNTHPATKEQRDTLMKAMADAGYAFDFENKELNKIDRQNTVNFNKEAEIEETLTTDDIPLPVLYKTLLKEWKRQDRIIEKQKKEIKKLKDKINELSSSV